MNRIAAGGLAAALCLATGVATADGPKPAPPAPKKADDKTPLRPSVIIAPLSAEVLAEAVKDERNACTRRLDACAKLREVAAAKNNEAMLQQIDELERQAVELCQARVARMGVRGKAAPTSGGSLPTPATVAPPVAVGGKP